MNIRSAATALLCVFGSLALSACVTLPPNAPRSPQDPYERWNRGVYKFNDAIDRGVVKPVARTYVKILPEALRTGIHNFFTNLDTPTVMINDALQGKLRAAGADLGRFLLNTTVGVGGLLDPATQVGIARNEEDFGLTLAAWGVHPGPFIELPLLGPSDVRDAPAKLVDTYTNPRQYIKNSYVKYGLYGVYFVDLRASLLSLDPTLQSVYDPYVFIRDAYLQRRAFLSGQRPAQYDDTPLDPDLLDPTEKPAGAPAASPTSTPAPAPTPSEPAQPGEPNPQP
jgi:phospholipid-binding lipoprotein MlaA